MASNIPRIPIKIVIDKKGESRGELIKFLAPRTIERLLHTLPTEGRIALLKEGIYFECPLKIGTEKAVKVVESGSLTYWPMANSICIFYEKTQPYSAMNIIGKVIEGLDLFKNLKSGTKLRIEQI